VRVWFDVLGGGLAVDHEDHASREDVVAQRPAVGVVGRPGAVVVKDVGQPTSRPEEAQIAQFARERLERRTRSLSWEQAMNEYLVTMTTHVPDGTSEQSVDLVKDRE